MYDVFKLEVTGDNEAKLLLLEFLCVGEAYGTTLVDKDKICRKFIRQLTDKSCNLYYIGTLYGPTDIQYKFPGVSLISNDQVYHVSIGITAFPCFNDFSCSLKAYAPKKKTVKVKPRAK